MASPPSVTPPATLAAVTRPEQDEDERDFIAEMVQRLRLDLEQDFVQMKPPKPDAELRVRGVGIVGIEVIEAHSQKLSEMWNRARRIVEERINEELHAQGVQASVVFKLDDGDASVLLAARRRVLDETARSVAEFARDVVSGAEPWFSKSRAQQRGIKHVKLIRVEAASRLVAGAACVTVAPPLGPGVIQAAIMKKGKKLTGYRQSFPASKYWLLIVGGLPVSGYVTAADAVLERFVSPFDKTVFLDRGSRCIVLDTDREDP